MLWFHTRNGINVTIGFQCDVCEKKIFFSPPSEAFAELLLMF